MRSESAAVVRETLEEYGTHVRAALRSYLRPPEPRSSVYDLASDYPERGGRQLRSSLCISSARAFGARLEDALNSAVALELMHNAFLVHDDAEDGSYERRGKATLHELHGLPVAVNVGDALAVLSLRPLIENKGRLGPGLTLRILEEAERMARESVEGQAIELAWRKDNALDLSEADYLHMILKKTCWYTIIYPCRVGAMLARARGVDSDAFIRFGFFVGAAFQIQDDLLNLVGDYGRYGKELDGDLWEGKRTVMLIRLLQVASAEERVELRRILGLERLQRRESDVRFLRDRIEHYGCIEHARNLAHALAGAALHEFELAFAHAPDSRDKRFLQALPVWVLERA